MTTKKKARNRKYSQKKIKTREQDHNSPKRIIARNIWILIVAVALIFVLKEYNKGYKWTFNVLIKGNNERIEKFSKLDFHQRFIARMGFTGNYFDFINKNTPKDAIIIMPPDSVFGTGKGSQKFDKYITRPGWANYFVYPRTLIFDKDKTKYPSVYDSARYVAIINYWGYDLLNYRVKNKSEYTVLSIKYKDQKK